MSRGSGRPARPPGGSPYGGPRSRGSEPDVPNRFVSRAGPELSDTQPIRRGLTRRVIALDPVIDEAVGESARMRRHSPILQAAVDGLFAALAGWRAVAVHLIHLPRDQARAETEIVLQRLPQELQAVPLQGEPAHWIADPARLRRSCEAAMRALIAQRERSTRVP